MLKKTPKNLMQERFDAFRKEYPNAKNHKSAAIAFDSAVHHHLASIDDSTVVDGIALLDTMLTAIADQKFERDEMKKRGEVIPNWPYPQNRLDNQCWLDHCRYQRPKKVVEPEEGEAKPVSTEQLQKLKAKITDNFTSSTPKDAA